MQGTAFSGPGHTLLACNPVSTVCTVSTPQLKALLEQVPYLSLLSVDPNQNFEVTCF